MRLSKHGVREFLARVEGRYQRAVAAGARVVTRNELVAIFRAKRAPAA